MIGMRHCFRGQCLRRGWPSVVVALGLALGDRATMCEAADGVNYDEAKVRSFDLPDPLTLASGEKVADAKTWQDKRRPELLELFRQHVYGRTLGPIQSSVVDVESTDEHALGGKATRKVIRMRYSGLNDKPAMRIYLFVPNAATQPVPVFVGIHLFDTTAQRPMPGAPLLKEIKVPAGTSEDRFPGEKTIDVILERGYAIASINPEDVSPDDADHYLEGVLPLQWEDGQTSRKPDDPGAIGAWAWALCRALDCFQNDPSLDAKRVIAIGHSRRGKTALWAGAQDERFAMVISNESGCGGAALSKRIYGETIKQINDRFPHWFCENFRQYNDNEDALPVDQHELVALIAPRPVYVASAAGDRWADPKGEFLACVGAEPVYRLLGKDGLGVTELPPLNQSIGASIGYHIRTGPHALSDFDWMCYLDFADRHLKGRR